MLETFTLATFAPHQGHTFQVQLPEGAPLALTLSEVTPLGAVTAPPSAQRAPFSLVFLGPAAPLLPQRIYRLSHSSIGTFDLFLVPLGPGPGGLRYEAIFS
jgi:hypothetical protein